MCVKQYQLATDNLNRSPTYNMNVNGTNHI